MARSVVQAGFPRKQIVRQIFPCRWLTGEKLNWEGLQWNMGPTPKDGPQRCLEMNRWSLCTAAWTSH